MFLEACCMAGPFAEALLRANLPELCDMKELVA